jgi:3',5'-cyclic AMP phosphodiesterase CpdA
MRTNGMKRLAWASDIHLNFVDDQQVEAFCREVAKSEPEAVLLSGDIADAPSLEKSLLGLSGQLQRPIYFVLGNHDFYGSSIAAVRERVALISRNDPWLHWLNVSGIVELTPETSLVGHDSWADGRLGAGIRSPVILNDFFAIRELSFLSQEDRFKTLAALGDEAAGHFHDVLPKAFERFPRLLLLTHVPPFRESCWHEGRISDDDFLPHFTCKAVGDVLRDAMEERPDRDLTVLCGHTHGEGFVEILPNLRVRTAGAIYGRPMLQPDVMIC